MKIKKILTVILSLFISLAIFSQKKYSSPKGKLFIIGGGDRSLALIQSLVATANLSKKDYIVVLPMSGADPDTSFAYTKADLEEHCHNLIANLNFSKDNINDTVFLDSLKQARLIFITGGQQTRFMKIVLHTPVYDAIHYAYNHGATVAGTSAGAAVMSKYMITGTELMGDSTYRSTFIRIKNNNIELNEGLGLIDSAIIDQHFVVRSRYNRLLSAIAKFPAYTCIGIDEATAIIVDGKKITVTGEGQVVVISDPQKLSEKKGLIKMNGLRFSIYTEGDSFTLK